MDDPKIIDFKSGGKPAAMSGDHAAKTTHMRSDLVVRASKIVTDPPLLINAVSKRVRQLNMGRSPLVAVMPRMGAADIALLEIIEGKIIVEDESANEA